MLASCQHPLKPCSIESLDRNERQLRHDAEEHHQPANGWTAPNQEERSGAQVGPVHHLRPAGLGDEAGEVFLGAAVKVPLGEPAVKEVAGAITPVPGGVGRLTVALLLRNTLTAAQGLEK